MQKWKRYLPDYMWWGNGLTRLSEHIAEIDIEKDGTSVENTRLESDFNVWYEKEWHDDAALYPGYFQPDIASRPIPPNPRVIVQRDEVEIPKVKVSKTVPAGCYGSGKAARRGMANTDSQRDRPGDDK